MVERGESALTLSMEEVITGNMVIVTAKVNQIEKSIHRIFFIIVKFEILGARNDCDSWELERMLGEMTHSIKFGGDDTFYNV